MKPYLHRHLIITFKDDSNNSETRCQNAHGIDQNCIDVYVPKISCVVSQNYMMSFNQSDCNISK